MTVAGSLTFLGISKPDALGILAAIAAALLVADLLRLRSRVANELFFRSFRRLASPREAAGLASSTWYAFGILLTLALVPRAEAVSAVLVLGLADPIASVIGQRYGRRPFLGGSVEGTATFVLVALLVLLPRHAWIAALPAAGLATLAERRSWPLDDNFTVPLVTGLTLHGVAALL